ncbi:ABC transporter substrate-binding protein [Rhodoferax ferrireducens]|uniref:ABC transporter substrate-binding protein n=1 Tax=Rhodoferax ferrireducens TaxID=192843 RepID=UPI000E0CDA24|nr:ABC transporter substrate binding protein [Rhodoferax ferrireducens]
MNYFKLMQAAVLCFAALPALAQSLGREGGDPNKLATKVSFSDAAQRDDFPRVLQRIEQYSDIVVYRLQVAANEQVFAQVGRIERVKVALTTDAGSIAVLYPDLDEPYRAIFAKIIEGIEAQVGGPVASYAVGGANSAQEIFAQLKRQDIKVVIALGRQGMKAASAWEREFGVIAGGVVLPSSGEGRNFPIISLAPDPKMLFERLKHFMPNARRVIVVYDPTKNAWLIRLARDAARSLGLELNTIEVTDLKSAVRVYQEVLASADPKRDALWLPQDSTSVEESSVLPLILESAWNRNLAVFSSNVNHVKRGALFSLYPNNMALGRQLASSALSLPAGNPVSVVPMKDALLAVNIRTASHLGLQLSTRQQDFDLVYPLR